MHLWFELPSIILYDTQNLLWSCVFHMHQGKNKVSNYKKYSERVQFGFLFMALSNNKQQKEIGQLLS